MTREEKIQLIKNLLWDYKLDADRILHDLETGSVNTDSLSRNEIFIKILNHYPWHTIRQLLPENLLPELLSDEVLSGVFPQELRQKYFYVRELL